MHIILLCGGSGKRLWPLSNQVRSKQFIKVFKGKNGYESMLQRVYKQIKALDAYASITIATAKSQAAIITSQLGEEVSLSIEPCRRDTFPAIVLAAAYLQEKQGVKREENVIICPVDPYVEADYVLALKKLTDIIEEGKANIALLGITPTEPSEKYGYIVPTTQDSCSEVKCFQEKPDEEKAKQYIEQGALWNAGVFACKLGYLIDKCNEYVEYADYQDLWNNYELLPKISFDYAVVEKEKYSKVMKFTGKWEDLGTWDALTGVMEEKIVGTGICSESCNQVHIINETSIPILAMGLKDVVISASSEGILISNKKESSQIKPYVEKIQEKILFAEKSWGSFKIIDSQKGALTIKVTLNKGHKMNYHAHKHRDEVWVVVQGIGITIVDGMRQKVKVGDVITMSAGCRHTIIAETELRLIEVQLGENISVQDKQKYECEYEI